MLGKINNGENTLKHSDCHGVSRYFEPLTTNITEEIVKCMNMTKSVSYILKGE